MSTETFFTSKAGHTSLLWPIILICPLVVTWYAITELGSILENLVALEVPLPGFFIGLARILKIGMDKTTDKIFPDESKE